MGIVSVVIVSMAVVRMTIVAMVIVMAEAFRAKVSTINTSPAAAAFSSRKIVLVSSTQLYI